jgi:hypothetical protein
MRHLQNVYSALISVTETPTMLLEMQYRPQGAEMSSANVTRMKKVYDPQSVVGDDLRHIQDLVFVRDLLAAHGATPAELKEYDAVIDGVRRRLAKDAKRVATRFPTAA